MRHIQATIIIEGDDAVLRACRTRINELLDAEHEVPYRELHTPGKLDYRTKGRGVPYPAFVAASDDFPDLTIAVSWENPASGEAGRATIQAGRLSEQAAAARRSAGDMACELRVAGDGALAIGVACRRYGGAWVGYVLTANEHAFFRLARVNEREVLEASDGVDPEWAERWTIAGERAEHALLEPRAAIEPRLLEELDRIANAFADEWIWFAESAPAETAVERQRYALYGYKVNAANVRAAKLKTALHAAPGGGFVLENADADVRAAVATLARHWLHEARH